MADTAPPSLVTFEVPPVNETVLSVGFEPIRSFAAAHVGRLQPDAFPTFSVAEERPAYVMPIERFSDGPPQLTFSVAQGSAPTRTAILTTSGDELYQLQRDWFAYNWRKVTGGTPYPRYAACRESFRTGWQKFRDFATTTLDAKEPIPTQAEITYLNHIPAHGVGGVESYSNLFTVLNDVDLGESVGKLERASLSASAPMLNELSEPFGRLHVALSPSVNSKHETIYVLNLTARGFIDGTDRGLMSFLDAGNKAIVMGFTAITTSDLHEQWRRL